MGKLGFVIFLHGKRHIFAWKTILFAYRFANIPNLVKIYDVKFSWFYLTVLTYQFTT